MTRLLCVGDALPTFLATGFANRWRFSFAQDAEVARDDAPVGFSNPVLTFDTPNPDALSNCRTEANVCSDVCMVSHKS